MGNTATLVKKTMKDNRSYSDKLKDPRWQKVRLEIFQRDNFTCSLCQDKDTTLHVHHLEYNGNPWDAERDKLVCLCEDCHELIEKFWDRGEPMPLSVFKYHRNPAGYHGFIVKDHDNTLFLVSAKRDAKEWDVIKFGEKSIKTLLKFISKNWVNNG